MISRLFVYIALLLCIYTVIQTARKKSLWHKNRTLYSSLFSLKAFIMGIIFSFIIVLMILKDYDLI